MVNTANLKELSAKAHAARKAASRRTAIKNALELADSAYESAMRMREAISQGGAVTREDATAPCQIVRAWDSAQERLRILRNQPLPGSGRPAAKTPKRPPRTNLPPSL